MENDHFSYLTLTAIQAALKAGDILRKGFGTVYEIEKKPGHQNFVTVYDRASENCIISFIQENFPDHLILAEESGFSNELKPENILWIIDPLDGTTNFAHHIPLFTISIAAYQGEKGLCGVIYQPLTHELFVAERNKGAYLNGTRLHVSQTSNIEDCIIVAGLPSPLGSFLILDIEQLLRQGVTLRNFGSAALALAYLAAGKVDALCMYHLYPWDIAAGQLLLEEAGGLLKSYKKSLLDPYASSHILAINQTLQDPLQKFIIPSNKI